MIQQRSNVFETNSSSVHSICIGKTFDNNPKTALSFNYGCMGWGWKDVSIRDYIWTMCCCDAMGYDDKGKKRIDYKKLDDYSKRISKSLMDAGVNCQCHFAYPMIDSWFFISDPEDIPFKLDEVISDCGLLAFMCASNSSFVELGNDNCEDSRPDDERMRYVYAGNFDKM